MAMQRALALQLAAPVETARLLLEPQAERHAESFFAPLQTDDAVYHWISMRRPESLEALRGLWRRIEADGYLAPDGASAWPTWSVRRKADGRYIGRVDAEIVEPLQASNIGFYFFSPFWGQGYATEATRGVTAALAAQGVARFVATVTVGNLASAAVLRKAGFTFTRLLPGNDCIRGEQVDDEEYVKTA